MNFQTPWCRFSRQLEPIFEEAYNNIHKKYINTEDKSVVFGSVNCDGQSKLIFLFSLDYKFKKTNFHVLQPHLKVMFLNSGA